jgi:[acyl-carrier-protein] S-malonyltransferase
MQDAADASSGGMASILGMGREQIESLCTQARGSDTLEVANLLCPGNIVVSGHKPACERITELATSAGAMKVIPLTVAGAFHTSLMQPAVERLRAALVGVPMKSPRIPVVSNVDAQPHDNPNEIRELLIQQVCSQVRWEDSMRYLLDAQGINQFYELGPGRVLCGLLKRIARKVPCENIAA